MVLVVDGNGIADNISYFFCTGVAGLGWFDVF
jgi:hypothetical protein